MGMLLVLQEFGQKPKNWANANFDLLLVVLEAKSVSIFLWGP